MALQAICSSQLRALGAVPADAPAWTVPLGVRTTGGACLHQSTIRLWSLSASQAWLACAYLDLLTLRPRFSKHVAERSRSPIRLN
jgi:hypothetical protein